MKTIKFLLNFSPVLLIITAILCLYCLASCGSALEENTWFSEEKLTVCLVADLPTIEKDYVNHNDEDIYVSFTDSEFEAYAKSVYDYLLSQEYKYLGTRGEQKDTLAGVFTTYYFEPATELESFWNEGDYIFVFSDGSTDENGDVEFMILVIYDVSTNTLEYGNKKFTYNTQISLRRGSEAPLSGFYVLKEEEHEQAEKSLEYKLLGDGTYEVKGIGTCADTEIVIPSEYQNRKVTSIGYKAFANNSTITSVTIPDSIKTIDEEAFYKCTELTSISIPDSVTSLGKSAFYECTKLVSLTLGTGIKTIATSTFCDCKALTSIVIPDGVTTIETNAFDHCEAAKSVTIPKSVTEIDSTAFCYTYSVENFIVAEDNESYTAIDGALFTKDKTELIQYPLGSTQKSFVLPDECTTITLAAMDSAQYVESITFGKGIAKLEIAAIINCTSLKEINVHEDNASFKAIDGNLYSKDGKKLVQYALNKDETSFTVPDGVEIIGTCSFKQAYKLESITLPSSLKTIESSAFFSCTSLKTLDIPDGITVLDSYIFAGCTSLESITVPSSVERIKFLTIAYCESLETIYFEGTQAQWDAISKDSQWAYEAAEYSVITE